MEESSTQCRQPSWFLAQLHPDCSPCGDDLLETYVTANSTHIGVPVFEVR